jgi:hypothetical protein
MSACFFLSVCAPKLLCVLFLFLSCFGFGFCCLLLFASCLDVAADCQSILLSSLVQMSFIARTQSRVARCHGLLRRTFTSRAALSAPFKPAYATGNSRPTNVGM